MFQNMCLFSFLDDIRQIKIYFIRNLNQNNKNSTKQQYPAKIHLYKVYLVVTK